MEDPTRPLPLIRIPTHSRDVFMGGLPPAYIMGQHYVTALAAAGAPAVLLPLYAEARLLRRLYEEIDGLFLAGGSDVSPATTTPSRTPS
jgi:putative glutamine amidotransferase